MVWKKKSNYEFDEKKSSKMNHNFFMVDDIWMKILILLLR